MELTTIIVTALTGSGGIVALVAVLLQYKQKMKELELQTTKAHEKIKERDEQILKVMNNQIPLEYHPLFTAIDEIEFFFLRSFELPDHGRTVVIREMCVTKLRVWRQVLKNYALDAQRCIDRCSGQMYQACNKAENQFSNMLLEGIEKYSDSWETPNKLDVFGKVAYDKASFETMHIFIPIFQEWHKSREEVVRLAAHDIPNSGMNSCCYEDWWDMLTVYMYAFTQMKYDAINAMKVLNGELTGQTIFGIVVGDIH